MQMGDAAVTMCEEEWEMMQRKNPNANVGPNGGQDTLPARTLTNNAAPDDGELENDMKLWLFQY